jgi:hypothetical protein
MRNLLKDLKEALSIKRSHGSLTEATYVASLAKRLNPTLIDGAGNLHIDRRGDHSRTLFVAHTDTVSRGEGANPIVVDGDWWCSAPNSTLGADDGAGIALLLHLMRRRVPGYYVFCRAEEVGGQGSFYLAQEHGDLLEQFDRAIAFDRRGVSSVITHQSSGRCCSDKFGEALANALSTDELLYATDNTGVFTDTANFTEYIPECTNISCAYEMEHSDKERLNVKHLKMLAQQIVKVDWESLPTARSTIVEEVSPHTWKRSQNWMRESKYDYFDKYDDASLTIPAAMAYDIKKLTVALKRALELAEIGHTAELEDILSAERTSRVTIPKFSDSQYYIEELNSGADPYEVIEDIYWGVRC